MSATIRQALEAAITMAELGEIPAQHTLERWRSLLAQDNAMEKYKQQKLREADQWQSQFKGRY